MSEEMTPDEHRTHHEELMAMMRHLVALNVKVTEAIDVMHANLTTLTAHTAIVTALLQRREGHDEHNGRP